MRVIVVRHAEAAPGEPDELRALTPAGRETAHVLAERLRGTPIDAVVSSPLLRARETAEPVARAAGVEPETDERLAPGATADDFRDVVAGRGNTVVVVGHQPDCGLAVLALTGGEVPFPPGGTAELDL
jgi:phosphohistidine phosphatase